jgi:hypothetical protein
MVDIYKSYNPNWEKLTEVPGVAVVFFLFL